MAPGIKCVDLLAPGSSVRTRLLRLSPRTIIPRHTHGGNEYTLVLSGGLSEEDGTRFERGDFRFRPVAAAHRQRVDPDQPCIALVVNEGALIPQTWPGKILSFLFDR